MTDWEFTLVIAGADVTNDAISEALYEATDGDIELSVIHGVPYTSFTRTGSSYQQAVLDAVKQVENAEVGVHVVRIQTPLCETSRETLWTTIRSRTGPQ